ERRRIAKRSHRSAWAVAVLIPTGLAASIERGAGGFSTGVVDGDAVRAKVAGLLRAGRDPHWRRRGAGVAEPVVVGEEEQFLLQRAEGNERTTEDDAVFIVVLNRLDGQASCNVGNLTEPTPGIEGGVAEELVDGTVELVAAVLNRVVHEALAFIHGPVAYGLHLELIDSIDGNCGPNIAWIAVAAGTDKGNAIDIDIGYGAAAA